MVGYDELYVSKGAEFVAFVAVFTVVQKGEVSTCRSEAAPPSYASRTIQNPALFILVSARMMLLFCWGGGCLST